MMLLADEPVSSLDSDWADQILAILRKESLEKQGCLVCTLHNENQVSEFADLELHIDEKNPTQWDLKRLAGKFKVQNQVPWHSRFDILELHLLSFW